MVAVNICDGLLTACWRGWGEAWASFRHHWFYEAVYMGQAPWNLGEDLRHSWWTQEYFSNCYITAAVQETVQESDELIFSDGARSMVSSKLTNQWIPNRPLWWKFMRWGPFDWYVQCLYLVNVKIKITASIHVCSLFSCTLNIFLLHCIMW